MGVCLYCFFHVFVRVHVCVLACLCASKPVKGERPPVSPVIFIGQN